MREVWAVWVFAFDYVLAGCAKLEGCDTNLLKLIQIRREGIRINNQSSGSWVNCDHDSSISSVVERRANTTKLGTCDSREPLITVRIGGIAYICPVNIINRWINWTVFAYWWFAKDNFALNSGVKRIKDTESRNKVVRLNLLQECDHAVRSSETFRR